MNIINYISNIAMPMVIVIIIFYGVKEKNKVFDTFLKGAKEGIETTFSIFPTLIGIFLAIGVFRNSGILDFLVGLISKITNKLNFPHEILPLAILRPISGSASIGIATDIMKQYGVDSFIGKAASTIMGATETTFYTIAIYTGCVGIKKTRSALAAALIADFVGIVVAVIVCQILS